MHVTVNYLGQVKRAAGVAGEGVPVPSGCTVAELIHLVARLHDTAFQSMVLDASGQPQRTLLYAVGDEQAELDRILHDGDMITILAPMAGG